MNLQGKRVRHKKYNLGTIVKHSGSYVTIKFDEEEKEKKFSYPSDFGTFLELLDESIVDEVSKDIEKEQFLKEQRDAEKQAKEDEQIISNVLEEYYDKNRKDFKINRHFSDVESFCDYFYGTICGEIRYIKENGGRRYRISNGKLESSGRYYVYTFDSETELYFPEGTEIRIWHDGVETSGNVSECDELTITINTESYFGKVVQELDIAAEPWQLLNALNMRLMQLKDNMCYSDIVRALICDGFDQISRRYKIPRGSDSAIAMSKTNPITFVWGPPGTGKTETLAKIVIDHINNGESVLMLSYSNVSVDGAILRVNKLINENSKGPVKPGRIVRYGYPRNEKLLNHDYLTSFKLALYCNAGLANEYDTLKTKLKELPRNNDLRKKIKQRISSIKNSLNEYEKIVTDKAEFVATTVSKATVDKLIYDSKYDLVIFDEASMAFIPQIVYAASLAEHHFVCMGDFNQLPPIVQSDNKSMLEQDIFQYCGISTAINTGLKHKWLCLLDTQYRMRKEISDFISKRMYHNLLLTDNNSSRSLADIFDAEPFDHSSMGMLDLSGMMSVCTRSADHSHFNVLSAIISCALVIKASKKKDVGIITPYNAQSRLIKAIAKDIGTNITCATVHQFQGSEKDIIVYDAVDCYRSPYPGIMLTQAYNNYANRLFNVAMSRAKGKFILTVNTSYMKTKKLPDRLMFRELIDVLADSNKRMNGAELLSSYAFESNGIIKSYNNDDAEEDFFKDLNSSIREVRIDVPGPIVNYTAFTNTFAKSIEKLVEKNIKVIIRTVHRADIPLKLRPYAIESPIPANPVVIMDNYITWFGMPYSKADFITEDGVIPTEYRPIFRFEGSNTAKILCGMLEMKKTTDHTSISSMEDNFKEFVNYTMTCRHCGSPLTLKTKHGMNSYFLSCSSYPACDYTERIDADLVNYYLNNIVPDLRCTCGAKLRARMGRSGVYVYCLGDESHTYNLDQI